MNFVYLLFPIIYLLFIYVFGIPSFKLLGLVKTSFVVALQQKKNDL